MQGDQQKDERLIVPCRIKVNPAILYSGNDETGLVRHFNQPPRRGKWTRISFDKREFPVDMNGVFWYC